MVPPVGRSRAVGSSDDFGLPPDARPAWTTGRSSGLIVLIRERVDDQLLPEMSPQRTLAAFAAATFRLDFIRGE